MGRLTPTVKIIIVANVILWVGTILFLKGNIINLNDMLAFHFPGSPLYKPWQFVTHMFMHANLDYGSGQVVIYHILFNMLGLWMFGSPLEQMWGRNKFIFFYFSAGVGAVLIQLGFNYYEFQSGMEVFETAGYSVTSVKELLVNYNFQSPSKQLMDLLSSDLIFAGESMQSNFLGTMLGASGALYGVLVAFAFSFPNAELMLIFLPIPIKAKYFVPLMILGDLFFGFSNYSTGIAHFAHIGGAITGFIMMWYWKKNEFNKNRWN
tara:strand:- start:28 stop:819 length:792 start_codon:yes stop_codon:yes gene_type:complete